MTGYTVHTGSTVKFSEGWDNIFSGAPAKKSATKKAAAKKVAAKKAVARKSSAKKGSAKKR